MTTERPAKTPTDSQVEMTQLVMPEDANNWGSAFGGKILAWIDIAAAIAAGRHSDGQVVTAAMDDVHFIRPIHRGHVVILKARINWVGRSSMEVGVRVEGEAFGEPRYHALTAYVTFVALDSESGKPRLVPRLELSSDEDRRREAEAIDRTQKRKALRAQRAARLERQT